MIIHLRNPLYFDPTRPEYSVDPDRLPPRPFVASPSPPPLSRFYRSNAQPGEQKAVKPSWKDFAS